MAAHSNVVGGSTAKRVQEVFRYSPVTGAIVWAQRTGPRAILGKAAGALNARGYYEISLDGRKYPAHRLAWAYVHGVWPTGEIDHINGRRDDNRLDNLRDVTRGVNTQNRRPASGNSCGYLGVSKHTSGWRARIQVDGVVHRLGTFESPEAARNAYLAAKRRLHAGCTI